MGKPESWAARRSGSGRRGGGDVPGHPVGAGSQPAAGRAAAHSALGLGAAAGSTRRGCHSPSGDTGGRYASTICMSDVGGVINCH